jgi:dTDP-4-dehydrorhamnose reductase
MDTILVTGSNGLLGQKIIYGLLDKGGVQIISSSRGPNRMRRRDGYQYVDLDITDAARVSGVFAQYKPTVVINCAAYTNVDACETNIDACQALNVDAVKYLVAECARHGSHLVHLSTDFVFDGLTGPYKEEDTPNPLSHYARTKLEAEKIIAASSVSWAIIRTIIIYGVVDDNSRSNVVLWTKRSLENRQDIRVINDQYRSPTLAEDLAAACIAAALKKAQGIYHVSGSEVMCMLDIVRTVAEYFKLDTTYIHPVTTAELKQPAARPPMTGFVIDKARRDLGYAPHTFLEGLAVVRTQLDALTKHTE